VKQLRDLLLKTKTVSVVGNPDVSVSDITSDSREVKPGSLFICLTGAHVDGHDFVGTAAEKGASVIVAQKEISVPADVTVVYVEDTRRAMEDITPFFFDDPSRKMRMVAVTGTNGKTTFTHIMSHIFESCGYKTGVIGTIHTLIGNREFAAHNTTPDVVDLERTLSMMVEAGVEYCCMEVSSHALSMGRVAGVEFDNASFTNLTEDHLDYHKTMDNYAKAKALLFQSVSAPGQSKGNKSCHINVDADYADVMLAASKGGAAEVTTYSIEAPSDLRATHISFNSSSSDFVLETKDGNYDVHTNLVGRFNVYNVLTAISASLAEGIPMERILRALADFHSVPGRFELIDEGQDFTVVVDYAHTPDGLENILKTAQEIKRGRILAVFGCGGDRDKLKRPIMGKIGARYADIVIVTSDNPRTEDPETIVSEVAAGVKEIAENKKDFSYEIIVSRRDAIMRAVTLAEPGDIVMIAGKGHEDYQILADRTIHFDDREEARAAIRSKLHGDI
jgi:UDP-N-acetylmuramoyl-L-alanyl-D-glutamate--2,6-diaminopimelate ligase